MKMMAKSSKQILRILSAAILVFLLIPGSVVQAQVDSSSHVNKKRLNTLIIGTSAAYVGTMIGLNEIWYSDFERQSFTFFNDNNEWKQMDKWGHFYSAFQLSNIGSRGLRWSGVQPTKADKIAALTSFLMISSIEVFDGFSSGYGASVGDLLANALGSGFYLGQQMLWKETRLHPKFSFHRTDYADLRPDVLGSSLIEQVIKDYNGQTYWVSVDADKFLHFPKWLNLGIGYGANGMVYATDEVNEANGYSAYRQYFLSLDFDVTAIKTNSKAVRTLLFFLNMIKIPGPTLEFSNGEVKAYAFYF